MKAFFVQLKHAHCKIFFLGKELEEFDGNPRYTYFEKQYDQTSPLEVCFFHK